MSNGSTISSKPPWRLPENDAFLYWPWFVFKGRIISLYEEIYLTMPYKIRRKKGGDYSVASPHGTKAKSTTRANAEAQVRLLQAIEHNPDFKPRKRGRKQRHHSAPNGEFLDRLMDKFGV